MSRPAAWGLVALFVASPLLAQRTDAIVAGIRFRQSCSGPAAAIGTCDDARVPTTPAQEAQRLSAWSVALSAVLPGSGQATIGTSRAFAYMAIEAFAWTSFVRHSLLYRRHRDGYRDLAARVARAPFSDFRPPGDFEYYERMTHYREAGRYDVIGGGALDPETDTATFNGAMWLLARRTYWSNPAITPDTASAEWMRALSFYKSRAYDQLYRWSWSNAPQEYSEFLDLIGESNDANRLAMTDLGVVIANHVLSLVDAYVTLRLRRESSTGTFALEGRVPVSILRK